MGLGESGECLWDGQRCWECLWDDQRCWEWLWDGQRCWECLWDGQRCWECLWDGQRCVCPHHRPRAGGCRGCHRTWRVTEGHRDQTHREDLPIPPGKAAECSLPCLIALPPLLLLPPLSSSCSSSLSLDRSAQLSKLSLSRPGRANARPGLFCDVSFNEESPL
uniref:Uncharacterized protein n=1 Tax=Malurus cyaneus samueli TaxID=2593467 RepID=A0A8C5TFK1_9PASS